MLKMIDPEYRTVPERRADGSYHYTAEGPGLLYYKPYFDKEEDARTFCVTLCQAYRAGKVARSREFKQLLDDDGVQR